jgi:hypothetical protein
MGYHNTTNFSDAAKTKNQHCGDLSNRDLPDGKQQGKQSGVAAALAIIMKDRWHVKKVFWEMIAEIEICIARSALAFLPSPAFSPPSPQPQPHDCPPFF